MTIERYMGKEQPLTLETQVHCEPTNKEEMIKVINDVMDLDPKFCDFLIGWMSNHHLEEMVLAAKRFREIYKL